MRCPTKWMPLAAVNKIIASELESTRGEREFGFLLCSPFRTNPRPVGVAGKVVAVGIGRKMWRKGKRKDDEGLASDGDEDAPAKKNPKRDSSDDSDSIVVCEISKNRRVSVRSWQGKVVVDIREFYTKDGKEFPGKKGISLSMDQWNVLREHVGQIDEAVTENS